MSEAPFNCNLFSTVVNNIDDANLMKKAESQRKRASRGFANIVKSLDNANSCEFLVYNLEEYNNIILNDKNNIYNELLKSVQPDIGTTRRFKVPNDLPKINFENLIKKLPCTNNTSYCDKSEEISQSELQQFTYLLAAKKESRQPKSNKITLQDRFDNLDRLQKPPNKSLQPEISPSRGEKTIRSNNEVSYQAITTARNELGGEKTIKDNKEVCYQAFTTARDELEIQILNKAARQAPVEGISKKILGSRKTARSRFVSPLLSNDSEIEDKNEESTEIVDQRLKHIEPKMVELITAEIMDQGPTVDWNDIAGLEFAKTAIQEAIVWPMLRPDIFTGLRKPPKGILLFGPPGTGKTLIGKCVASQSKSTFFCISASSLTSKWIGDGEKMVRALFAVARVHQPAVIFIDEVDSLLTQRSDTEHESSRRIKTEFLVQLDGATTDCEERLLVIGATNRPQELDEAARRRFVKRLYIPLPEHKGRLDLLKKVISPEKHSLTEEEFSLVAELTAGYSGADIKNLCSEAALGPIRSVDFKNIHNIQASEVRPMTMQDFEKSLKSVRPSVSQNDLIHYIQWDTTYGTGTSI